MQTVIFDTDPGVDDALALLYLARHPEIRLAGVTTVFGNASVATTTRNARFLCAAWGIEAPVHAGAAAAIDATGAHEHFPVHIHGDNGLGNYPVPDPVVPVEETAARFLVDTICANPGQVRILAVGRMTNLARALDLDPGIATLVQDIVIMGGAFDTQGNISPVAEANLWGDPEAADRVFGARWPVTAIPLNVTRTTLMSRPRLQRLADHGDAAMKMVADLSQDYIDFYLDVGADGMMVHDCTAAVFLTDPGLFMLRHGAVRVASGGLCHGQTVQKPAGMVFPPSAWDDRPDQAVAIAGDADAILDRIARTCAGAPHA